MRTFPPQEEEYSLGYYLTKYVGNESLPFPFMDILHQLHQEHQENQEISRLNEWMAMLDTMISSLDVQTDLSTL